MSEYLLIFKYSSDTYYITHLRHSIWMPLLGRCLVGICVNKDDKWIIIVKSNSRLQQEPALFFAIIALHKQKRKRAQHLQNGETSLSKIDGCDLAKSLSHNGTNYILESHFYFLRLFVFVDNMLRDRSQTTLTSFLLFSTTYLYLFVDSFYLIKVDIFGLPTHLFL